MLSITTVLSQEPFCAIQKNPHLFLITMVKIKALLDSTSTVSH